ncbi:MAG TPA: hypothetical protein VEF90_04380 [Xanthobacteraceae bacterium]|nr:hypothetical protein [Xanthobacteraceae bacterium]
MKLIIKLVTATAVVAMPITFDARSGRAFGDAPWCAVIEIGDGDVYWDCQYRTVEECAPNVVAGNRGFCNLNPYGPPAAARTAVARPRHSKRHVRRD